MREPRLVDLPETTVVGLRVVAPFAELRTAVPAAWREVFARSDELSERLDEGFAECSLGAADGVYSEIVGARMPAGSLPPPGMDAVVLPGARYATLKHDGPLAAIGESFGVLESWIATLAHEGGARLEHDGVKLDVGYRPNEFAAADPGAGHELYARVAARKERERMTMEEGPAFESIEVGEHMVAELISGGASSEREITDIVGNASFLGVDFVLLRADQLPEEFFDLSSGFAGMVMQKFSNYRLRLVVVGGPGTARDHVSESLAALIRESNRGAQTWFVIDRAAALARIAGA